VLGIVAGDATCDNVHRHEDVVCPHVCRLLWCIVHVGVNTVGQEDNWHSCCSGLCGPLALANLVHVPLFKCNQDVNVLVYMLSSKTRPALEVPCFDGFDQCGEDREVQTRIIEMCELVHG
jgi:hypothetical protein